MGFVRTRRAVGTISKRLATAARHINDQTEDPAERLRDVLGSEPWVMFAGAGISVDPPTSAPTFVQLRNASAAAITRLLVELDYLSPTDGRTIERALHNLALRTDISLEPAKVFNDLGRWLGQEVVRSLVVKSLSRGTPNANHQAAAELIRQGLTAIITPNFDEYLESAIGADRIQLTSVITTAGSGFPIFKPHGSLGSSDDLTIEALSMAASLKGLGRQIFHDLVAHKPIVVVGYGGGDRDLLPLLIHSGREWGCELIWVLYDRSAINQHVAAAQLALGDRCTVIDGKTRSVLCGLAGLAAATSEGTERNDFEELILCFSPILASERVERLVPALLVNLFPAGVRGSTRIAEQLASRLLDIVGSRGCDDAEADLRLVGVAEPYLRRGRDRARARELGLAAATRTGRQIAVDAWSHARQRRSGSARSRLQEIEEELRLVANPEMPFDDRPDGQAIRIGWEARLRVDRAILLWHVGDDEAATREARQLLAEAPWASSPMDNDVVTADDVGDPSRLHRALANALSKEDEFDEADLHLATAIELLWSWSDLWRLGNELAGYIPDIVMRSGDDDLAKDCIELAIDLARLAGDVGGEIVSLEWLIHHDFADTAECRRALALVERGALDPASTKRVRNLVADSLARLEDHG
jgi:hypothetical protein